MKIKTIVSLLSLAAILLLGAYMVFVWYPSSHQSEQTDATLTPDEQNLLPIAEKLALENGYTLSDYKAPTITFDSEKDEWHLYYEVKGIVYPGGCFDVYIHSKTENSRLDHCE